MSLPERVAKLEASVLGNRLASSQRQFVKFLVVGILNTAVGYGIFALLVWMKFGPSISLFLATVLGVLFNYLTTGRLVFSARGLGRLPFFVAVYGFTFLSQPMESALSLIGRIFTHVGASDIASPDGHPELCAKQDFRVSKSMESMKKTISIVTPCFNEEENVRSCYEAVKVLFSMARCPATSASMFFATTHQPTALLIFCAKLQRLTPQ